MTNLPPDEDVVVELAQYFREVADQLEGEDIHEATVEKNIDVQPMYDGDSAISPELTGYAAGGSYTDMNIFTVDGMEVQLSVKYPANHTYK